MGRGSHGFGQESYDEKAMWMESQGQQQQRHDFHEESWSTPNHHKQQHFPGAGMQLMKPSGGGFGAAYHATDSQYSDLSKHHHHGGAKLGGGGNYGMFHENSMTSGHAGHGHSNHGGFGHMNHGSGKKHPYGGGMFNHHGGGGHHDYVSEDYEYEAHREEHVGAGMAKMDEKRYEHHNYGGDIRYAKPYGGGGYNNMNMMKPHGYGGHNHKIEWSVKGV